MTTHRRYWWVNPQPWAQGRHEEALEFLERACERSWWYRDPVVEGAPYDRLTLVFTVSGRDQWWCHRRAQKLALDVYWMLGLSDADLPEPVWERLAPHENRGRYRFIAAP